jgi:hypothetical protein
MRFCNMKRQNSIGILKMKFIFNEVWGGPRGPKPLVILWNSTARLEAAPFQNGC